jgi:hypothetical protein
METDPEYGRCEGKRFFITNFNISSEILSFTSTGAKRILFDTEAAVRTGFHFPQPGYRLMDVILLPNFFLISALQHGRCGNGEGWSLDFDNQT